MESAKKTRLINYKVCELGHPHHDTLVVPTAYGDMTIFDEKKYRGATKFCTGNDAVSQVLHDEGMWDINLTKRFCSILEDGDRNNLVLDVGCHLGWYSRIADYFGYPVYSYDGNAENLRLLSVNVPSAEASLVFFEPNVPFGEDIDGDVELMKIDIEGNERFAYQYFASCLPQTHNILMEISPIFNDSYPELIEKFSKLFDVFEIDGEPFNFDYNFAQKDVWLRRKHG